MKNLRIRVILLASWLVVFNCAEGLMEIKVFSNITFTLILLTSVITLASSRLEKIPLWIAITIPLAVLVTLKGLAGALFGGLGLAVTIAEVCSLGLTIILTEWVNKAINEFENAVAHITIGNLNGDSKASQAGQETIYREVRRARNHHRPMVLMAIGVEKESITITLDRIVQEVQQKMLTQYALSAASKILCNQLADSDVIVQDEDHFLVVLPETTKKDIPMLVERIRRQVMTEVGIDLKFGVATLPEDGYTFEGLLDKATTEMENGQELQSFLEFENLSVKNHHT